jgi:hypothetical protein
LRILFLTENFPPETNAAATRVFERAVYWVEWGHEVTIITCAPNFPEGKLYNGYKKLWYQTEKLSGKFPGSEICMSSLERQLFRTVFRSDTIDSYSRYKAYLQEN